MRQTFTFSIPAELRDKYLMGSQVLVRFRQRPMVGVCVSVSETAPNLPGVEFKTLTGLLDGIPALTPRLIKLGKWVSSRDLAPIGECLRAMLPPQSEIRNYRQVHADGYGSGET